MKLFGTDGIRGIAGKPPLTERDLFRIGRQAGRLLSRRARASHPAGILLVRDTRISGAGLAKALASGFVKEGVVVFDAGVLPTPSLACLVPRRRLDGGAVVSASHNPPQYNGVKFLTSSGSKWPGTWERHIERGLATPLKNLPHQRSGRIVEDSSAANEYLDFLKTTFPSDKSLSGLRLVVDCAQGATSCLAPRLFQELGAHVIAIGNHPTGRNINRGFGTQHPRALLSAVRKYRAHAGVAFDGDGDRVVFGDERGRLCDGDHIIGILASEFKRRGELNGHQVVITVMANVGLRKALSQQRIRWVETSVGDRYVSSAMRRHHAVLGGEQSGHIVLSRYLQTGDGMLTALQLLSVLASRGRPLSALAACVKKYPQVLLNVRVSRRTPIDQMNDLKKSISEVEGALEDSGRVLVRYSGTEPALRIMVEGPSLPRLKKYAGAIARTAERCLS